jgi:hypothetical protein
MKDQRGLPLFSSTRFLKAFVSAQNFRIRRSSSGKFTAGETSLNIAHRFSKNTGFWLINIVFYEHSWREQKSWQESATKLAFTSHHNTRQIKP